MNSHIKPVFSSIPIELVALNRWLVWRYQPQNSGKAKKVPMCAAMLRSNASSTDPDTWSSFALAQTAYEEGGFSGVGFALNGDGLVGIDLDNCVIDGIPSEQAMAILESIGCQYVELSPSGKGLRSFGYVDNPPLRGARGSLNGVSVELYSTGQYLTVTGHVHRAGPLAQLPGYLKHLALIRRNRMTEETEGTEDTEDTQKTEVTDLSSSVPSPQFMEGYKFPAGTVPTGEGQRNYALFLLAKNLKGKFPLAKPSDFIPLLKRWYELAREHISTKDFRYSRTDFSEAWENVNHPDGKFNAIVAGIDSYPIDNPGKDFSDGADKLYQLCLALQAADENAPFFLGCREAGQYIGTSHDYAAKLLKAFVGERLLELVLKGWKGENGKLGKSSRYTVPAKHRHRAQKPFLTLDSPHPSPLAEVG